jgi:aryl-alcohol dehydrogenase-like predicted oxidoreductase
MSRAISSSASPSTKFDKADFRGEFQRFLPENLSKNMRIIEWLEGLSKKKGATPAQVSLAWLLASAPSLCPFQARETKRI